MKHKQKLPLPLELVKTFEKDYPHCWEHVEYLREGKGKDLPNWNNLVYIPITGTNEILHIKYGKNKEDINLSGLYAALASWRQYKEIYSFSPELCELLFEQAGDNIKIPTEILYRMPYPCMYISFSDTEGFFVFFEQDMNSMQMELRFCCLEDNNGVVDILNMWLHLSEGNTISDGIAEGMELIKQNIKDFKFKFLQNGNYIIQNEQQISEYLYNLISKYIQLVLYICAENAEIEENPVQKQITRKPQDNRPKDVYREIRSWDVGVKFASNVRKARQVGEVTKVEGNSGGAGTSKRPHTRKGHWHHYWTGSHSDNSRKLILKWTAPTFVGGKMEDTITTVNRVK